ncbi:MAG: carbamoyltransferase HypF, partial [Burkholderiaceae bacterium]
MNTGSTACKAPERAERIRVRGLVQGVGFRPTVWRLAQRYGMRGTVANDGQGVAIHVCGDSEGLDAFVRALRSEAPALARVDCIERENAPGLPGDALFRIIASTAGPVLTGVVPDAVSCAECVREVFDPFQRRYRYPFTNCTHCGPRLSIIQDIPYDRASTTMETFGMCPACRAEYDDPADRRFHAQPIACHACGPRAWLERSDGAAIALDALTTLDAVDAVCSLLQRGEIVAIKGLGGFQLACDATQEPVVVRLRERKQRERKPFALMARDTGIVRQVCALSVEEETLLHSPAGPIVLLDALPVCGTGSSVAASVAPGLRTLGFMLPPSVLHHLLLRRMNRPIVLTSGNLADEPQAINNQEAKQRLGAIADYFLLHDRDITRRVDDSVLRLGRGGQRVLRRARGLAPAPIVMPMGFDRAPPVLALGGELKNTFCLLQQGQAIVSHHIGDLDNLPTLADYRSAIDDYLKLFRHAPRIIAIDQHPEYRSSKHGLVLADSEGVEAPTLCAVQHHHAHIAACLAENGVALDAKPVLGVALDGLGYGEGGELWGGEFLLADYARCQRLATFKPVALLGGEQASREPWRNTYAHLMAEMGWPRFLSNYEALALCQRLASKPRAVLDSMLLTRTNSPLASSCGRLFDAVAAAAGVCFERAAYEGQAAIEFETLADAATLNDEDDELAYPFGIPRLKASNLPYIEPLAMWQALLGDLILHTPVGVVSARFHKGLAIAITRMVDKLAQHESPDEPLRTVALSGGVFQNRVLLEQVVTRLQAQGFEVLTHRMFPAG